MSQNAQLPSLQAGEGTRAGSDGSQQCASGGFWSQCPPRGCLKLDGAQGARKEVPALWKEHQATKTAPILPCAHGAAPHSSPSLGAFHDVDIS